MRGQNLTIQTILLLTISALTLLVTLLASREVYLEWNNLKKIQALRNASSLSDHLFTTTEKLSVERDIALSMLLTSDAKTSEDLHSRLMESREDSVNSFNITMMLLKNYSLPELTQLHEKIQAHREIIKALRKEIDQAVTLPIQERPAELTERWLREVNLLVEQTHSLWTEFIRHFTNINPAVTQHLRFKHLMRIITDYAGRERSLIGKLIVENVSPTPAESVELLRGQGIIMQAWSMSELLGSQSRLFPDIAPAYNDARSHYLTTRDMFHNIFYIPGAKHDGSYPISADLWFELSTQASESMDALKAATLEKTRNFIIELEKEAQGAIFTHLILLGFTFTICLYSFWIIAHRVIRPINMMIESLLAATQGKPATFRPPGNRQDEIGKLGNVLDAFQESSQRYQALIQASSQIIWTWKQGVIDKKSPLSHWWQETTGLPSETIATFGWLDVVHPADRDTVRKIWEDAMAENKNFEMEYRLRTRSGNYIHVEVRGVAVLAPDGKVREFIGSLSDVTARKQAQQEIRDSAERLRAVFDTVVDGIITIDKHATIQSFNASAERIFGYKADEVIGQNVKMLMPEPYHSNHDNYVHNYQKTGEAKIIGIGREVSARRKDGSVFPMELGVNEFSMGEETAFVGIIRDITQRKTAEMNLLNYNRALERSNKELDDFAYIASHDLKEPLRGIHNHSRFLLEDNQEKLDKDSVNKLNRLIYLSQRMERLVNDLLYFSRLGRQELAIQSTDLNEVLHDIENTLELFLTERKAKIVVPKPLPVTICDKPRVSELFRNLITNGVKYNDKPEKIIEIGFLPSYTASHAGTFHNVFYVRDNGKGIAREFHQEIFRIFKRLQSSSDSGEEGTGVGLTFVKKIIDRHGGVIFLESEPGKGTTFYFTLKEEAYDTNQTT